MRNDILKAPLVVGQLEAGGRLGLRFEIQLPLKRTDLHWSFLAYRLSPPQSQRGRHPQHHFRDLLELHSRYGLPACSPASSRPCHEASIRSVTLPNRLSATMPIYDYMGGTLPHWSSAPSRRTGTFGLQTLSENRSALRGVVEVAVQCGHHNEREQRRSDQPSDDNHSQRPLDL